MDPKKTAIVLVDDDNDFLSEGGKKKRPAPAQ